MHEPGGVAPWMRETGDETAPDGVADLHEYDRHRAGFFSQGVDPGVTYDNDRVGRGGHQCARVRLPALNVAVGTNVD